MREDFEKVVTERPRSGHKHTYHSSGKRARWKREDYESAAKRGPMSRHRQYGFESKEFSDLIGPLYKYLTSNVGRPWNAIYSEICKNLPAKTLSAYHIKHQHLMTMVNFNYIFDEKTGNYYHRYYSKYDSQFGPRPFCVGEYYVDVHGILREGALSRKKFYNSFESRSVLPPSEVVIDGERYQNVRGAWTVATTKMVIKEIPVTEKRTIVNSEGVKEVIDFTLFTRKEKVKESTGFRYLTKAELKTLGLENINSLDIKVWFSFRKHYEAYNVSGAYLRKCQASMQELRQLGAIFDTPKQGAYGFWAMISPEVRAKLDARGIRYDKSGEFA